VLSTDPLAPTAIRDPDAVIDDHLADALVALELECVSQARVVADLGSGAGVPGLPLAIAKPLARFSLIESSRRKCEFLERAIRICQLGNVTVVHARAEAWVGGIEGCELVTARAVDAAPVVAEYAAPLLRMGGVLVLWQGRPDAEAEADTTRALDELGLRRTEVRRVRPYDGAEHRYLHVISKVRDTPPRFPRREGIARKRPLGASLKANLSDQDGASDRTQR
jgi:16S rRNA (guanine527-N7)-methyltransferase